VDEITPAFGSDHAQIAAAIGFGRIMMCVEHTGALCIYRERKRVLVETIPKMAKSYRGTKITTNNRGGRGRWS
jgi:hypothetical protein